MANLNKPFYENKNTLSSAGNAAFAKKISVGIKAGLGFQTKSRFGSEDDIYWVYQSRVGLRTHQPMILISRAA